MSGEQRIGPRALRLEEREVLGTGRQRHDAHAGRQHRIRQHPQRLRNRRLLHLVGDVEILELAILSADEPRRMIERIAGQIDDGVGDKGLVLGSAGSGSVVSPAIWVSRGSIFSNTKYDAAAMASTRNGRRTEYPSAQQQLLLLARVAQLPAEAGINLVHCPKYPPPLTSRRRAVSRPCLAHLRCAPAAIAALTGATAHLTPAPALSGTASIAPFAACRLP